MTAMGSVHSLVLNFLMAWICHEAHSHTVPIHAARFMASVRAGNDSGTHVCAGSIIHKQFVLTAASCFYTSTGDKQDLTKVLVGTDNLLEGGFLYDINKVIPHPKFFLQTGNYDVGLIKLTRNLTFGPDVGKINLIERNINVGYMVQVLGWKYVNTKNGNSTKLYIAPAQIVPRRLCQNAPLFGRIVTKTMICAGESKLRHCVEDAGSPLLSHGVQAAVASRHFDCDAVPTIYTSIQPARKWIVDIIGNV